MSETRAIQGLRLLALALAILTWYFVRASELGPEAEMTSFTLDYPIRYVVPTNEVTLLESTESVRLTLQGRDSVVGVFNPVFVSVAVEVPVDVSGPLDLPLTEENLTLPEGLTATLIDPGAARVVIDQLATKELPIVAIPTGEAAAGALVEEITVSPAVVTVRGPESELKQHESLLTPPVDLTNRALDFRQRSVIIVPDRLSIIDGPTLATIDVKLRIPGAEENGDEEDEDGSEESSARASTASTGNGGDEEPLV